MLKPQNSKVLPFIDNFPLPYQSLDEKGTIIQVNTAWLDALGYSYKDVVGKKFGSFLAPDSIKLLKENFKKFLSKGEVREVEYTLVGKNGQELTVSFDGNVEYDDEDQFRCTHCFFIKITERMQVQQEIEMLLDLSRKVSIETNLNDLLFFIADKIVQVISPAEAAAIFLYDEEREVVRIQAWAGYNASDVKGIEFKVAGSQIGKIFLARKPAIIKNVSEDPDFMLVDKPGAREIKSQIIVPLIYKKRVIGIIYADNLTRTDAFSQKNLDLLESIGNQSAGMIENARLLDQMRESEKQYHSVVEDSPGVINRFLPDGTITFANQAYCRFFGKKQDELIGMNIKLVISEDGRESIMSYIGSFTEESPVKIIENKVIRYDGKVRWMRWADRALFDEKGKVTSYQSFGEDITERKLAEEKLKISEERFRAFMANVPAFAYIKDSELRHVYGNPAAIEFDRLSSLDKYIGTTAKNILSEKIAREVESNDKRVLAEKCNTRQEFTVVRGDGKEHTLLDIKFPIQLPDGTVQIGGLAIDITEIKEAQKVIQEERDKAQKYLDIAEVMIVALNKKGEITLVNQKGASILGYKIEELIGKNWFETCLPDWDKKRAKNAFNDFMADGEGLGDHFEQIVITKAGKELIIDSRNTPLWEWVDDEKCRIGSLGSGEDITERVRVEKENWKFNKIIETTTQSVIITNMKGTVLYVNQSYYDFSGFAEDEVIGRSMFTFASKKGAIKLAKEVIPALIKKKYWLGEMNVVKKDKQIVPVELNCSLLSNKQNKPEFFVAIFSDISERKRMEQLLKSLNRAAVAVGTAQTQEEIFKSVAEELEQLDINCVLFPLDETRSKLVTKYASHESALIKSFEKLVNFKHENYSFPIDAVDVFRRVIKGRKTLLEDASEQTIKQLFPNQSKKLITLMARTAQGKKVISAPLIVENEVIGIFLVQSDSLTKEDIPAITAFADQLSSAWNKIELLQNLRKTVEGTIRAVAATVEARDPYTAGHQTRVADLTAAIAKEMHLTDEQVEGVRMAGIVHDLGKINIPAEILSKPGKLSELEFNLIKTHPQNGFDLLKDIEFPWPIAEIVLQHHEKMDGSGYPQGLKGEEILLEARILCVADIVEAMSSHRPYRPSLGIEKALAQIKMDKGTLFDPKVVDACLKIFKGGYQLPEG